MAGGPTADYTPLRARRYERKFLVEELILHQVLTLVRLHPQMFWAPYPPRYINNLYLDTADLENYHDNVRGAERRRKVRVRWYGELGGTLVGPVLECKFKEGPVGGKLSYPLNGFPLDAAFSGRTLQRAAAVSNLPTIVQQELRTMQVVLLNRYYRHYFASRDGRFRVTVDTELAFYRANGTLGNSLAHRQVDRRGVILELKYDVADEPAAGRVAGFFPFRMTRSSKYVQGMERVYF